MESALPRFMETTFDYRPGLLVSDDGFDPVLEIRRLRHDLILRLQRVQQSVATEEIQRTDDTLCSTSHDALDKLPSTNVPTSSESEAIIEGTPTCRKLNDSPSTESEGVNLVPPTQSEFSPLPVAEAISYPPVIARVGALPVETTAETDLTKPAETTVVSWEEQPESLFTRVLVWLNTVLMTIGAVSVIAGIYYHLLRKQFANPQLFAATLFITGIAMVLIGIIGWWLHRQKTLQFWPRS